VTSVQFRLTGNQTVQVQDPTKQTNLTASVQRIAVTFNAPVKQTTVTTASQTGLNPNKFSCLLRNAATQLYIVGTVQFPAANRMEFIPGHSGDPSTLGKGKYEFLLFGDPNIAAMRPAIQDDPQGRRLDGEANAAWPSGDGVEGGGLLVPFTVS
jgi:hypothetical protein